MSKGSAPPAPDYTGAAQATAQGNLANLNAQTAANRPDQVTPWGTSSWTNTPGTDGTSSWTQNITLSPDQQAALNSQQQIQQNQSQLAQTMQGQVSSQMQNGFTAPSMDSYTSGVPSVNGQFSGFNPTGVEGVDQRYIDPSSYTSAYNGLNTNFTSNGKQNTTFGGGPSLDLSFNTQTPQLNTTFNSGVPGTNTTFASSANPVNVSAPQFDQSTANAGTKAAYSASTGLLTDQWQQDTKNLDSQLRMQGLTPGTEAYNNAMQNLTRVQGQQQDQLANQAVLTGNQLANTNYASALAGYQSQNAAQQQQFSQDATGFGLTNDARNQAYTNSLNGFNATNQARSSQFGQDLSSASFNNNAATQQFQNNLNSYNSQNAANNTQYQNDLSGFNANNTASTQTLQNGLAQYSAALQGQSQHNTAVGQAYNQALATYGAGQQAQLNSNSAQQQSYQQAMQQYQTAYQNAYQNYLQPLNSMNAVLTGQQVSVPQMPGFTSAGYTPGADYTGAASSLGQYNSGVAAQNSANSSSMLGTVGSLAGAAAIAF